MKRIMFDVDGVLADFVKAYTSEAVRLGILDRAITTSEQPEWSFEGIGMTKEDGIRVWQAVDKHVAWWYSHIEPLFTPQQANRIGTLMLEHEVYFVTNRMIKPGSVTVQMQTASWLNSMGITNPSVIPAVDKASVAKTLGITHAIDDKPENCVAIAEHVHGTYMFTRRYNQLHFFSRRVKSLDEFLEICEAV